MKNVFASTSKIIKIAFIVGLNLQAGSTMDAPQVDDPQKKTIDEMKGALLLSPFNASNFPNELQGPILSHAAIIPTRGNSFSFGNVALVCKYWHHLRNSYLPACINDKIPSDSHLNLFKNIFTIRIDGNTQISDNCLGNLGTLKKLTIKCNQTITDNSVSKLTGLESLIIDDDSDSDEEHSNEESQDTQSDDSEDMFERSNITNISLGNLTNLRALCFGYAEKKRIKITDESLSKLTNLTTLIIPGKQGFKDKSLGQLTNLTYLNMYDNPKITDDAIKNLTNLRVLDCHQWDHGTFLTIDSLRALPCLEQLTLGSIGHLALDLQDILAEDLMLLTNLNKLNLYSYSESDRDKISSALPNVEVIDIDPLSEETDSASQ